MDTLNEYRRLIADSGLNAHQIAQRTGLSPHTVGAVMKGEGNPTIGTLELIRIAVEASGNAS